MAGAVLKPWRLNLLRLAFGVMGLGLAVTQWPLLAAIGPAYAHLNAVAICLFSALGLMALVGILRPLEMLPILLFEFAWKFAWLALVGIPAWLAGTASPAVAASLFEIGLVVVLAPLVPWEHIVRWLRHGASADQAPAGGNLPG